VTQPEDGAGQPPGPTLDDARAALAAQPFSVLLGAEIVDFRPGAAVLGLGSDERLLQQHGFVHGGVVAYLADNAITFAAGSVLGPAVLTAGMSLRYVAPARGDLLATARVTSVSGRTAECECEVTSNGVVCAVAAGTARRTGKAAESPGEEVAPTDPIRP
jgi:uncharacterized protein (TIGR00369 family)